MKNAGEASVLYLPKLLPLFVYPLGLTFCLVFLALLGRMLGRKKLSGFLFAAGFGLLWAASTPLVALHLYGQLEGRFAPVRLEDVPKRDCIVVLGGVIGEPSPPRLEPARRIGWLLRPGIFPGTNPRQPRRN